MVALLVSFWGYFPNLTLSLGPTTRTGAASGSTLQEIAALSAAKLAEQVRAVIAGQFGVGPRHGFFPIRNHISWGRHTETT